MNPKDLSPQLAMISLFQRADPDGFHRRLREWCKKTNVEFPPSWDAYQIVSMMDDESVIRLGATLRRTLMTRNKSHVLEHSQRK